MPPKSSDELVPRILQGIARERAPGEEVAYRRSVHPGIIRRLLLMHQPPDRIAAAIGISVSTLNRWLKSYPELVEACEEVMHMHAQVVESAWEMAVGYKHPVTKQRIASVAMIKFWLQTQMPERFGGGDPDEQARRSLNEATSKIGDLVDAIERKAAERDAKRAGAEESYRRREAERAVDAEFEDAPAEPGPEPPAETSDDPPW